VADEGQQRVGFRPWQWAEIGLLIVLIYCQIGLKFTVLKDRPGLDILISLVVIALMVHMYTWLVPIWKARRR
jgi:uncharacterized membrane protein YczE